MNVYHRLLNILAEQSQPEYWTIDELIHYLDLAQRQFATDTNVLSKTTGLIPAFDENEPASKMPVTISTVLNEGLYQIPADCLEIKKVYWQGKMLDHENIEGLNNRFAGNSHYLGLKGRGRLFSQNWRDVKGETRCWAYDNGIRIMPREYDNLDYLFITLPEFNLDLESEEYEYETIEAALETFENLVVRTEKEVTSKTVLYWQFARIIKEIDKVKYLDEGLWEKLDYNKDYFASSSMFESRILFSDEILSKICHKYDKERILPTLFLINPSTNATIDYVPIPKIKHDIRTLNDKGVELEIQSTHHEAIACYAAFLALSKEGKKSQDIEKAQIYLQRYQEYTNGIKRNLRGSISVDYNSLMPFKV